MWRMKVLNVNLHAPLGDHVTRHRGIDPSRHCRRAKKSYPKDSMEVNADLGEALLKAYPGLRVDVHQPEILLNVEIREKIYIYSEIIPGPGGMPVGTGGKAMLLSWGHFS